MVIICPNCRSEMELDDAYCVNGTKVECGNCHVKLVYQNGRLEKGCSVGSNMIRNKNSGRCNNQCAHSAQWVVALMLCLVFSFAGFHLFYVRRILKAVVIWAMNVFIGLWALLVMPIIFRQIGRQAIYGDGSVSGGLKFLCAIPIIVCVVEVVLVLIDLFSILFGKFKQGDGTVLD